MPSDHANGHYNGAGEQSLAATLSSYSQEPEMTEMPGAEQQDFGRAKIKVVGVGGGGSNAVSRMYRDRLPEVEYMVVNTDAQALVRSEVPVRVRIGDETARGLGVGGDPEKGQACAEESRDELREVLHGADMVF
ncbi:MAG: hypothetical protein ACOC5M_01570, partial [Chloroflexota bacterium]